MMVKTFKILQSNEFAVKVCKALHVDPDLTGKVTINLTPQEPIIVTVEVFAPEEFFDIDLSNFAGATEID